MDQVQLNAVVREERGKGAARKARRSGYVPAVLYGAERSATALHVPAKDMELFLQRGASRLLDLQLDNGTDAKGGASKGAGAKDRRRTAIVKDVQVHPAKGDILHVDFQAVSMDQEVTTAVPVRVVGEEQRENDGGIVTLSVREIEIACRADAIPEHIEVDVAKLAAGESLTVADLTPEQGIRLLAPADEVVVSILEKSRAAEPEESADAPKVGEEDQGDASDAS